MKTTEERNSLKEEVETVSRKLQELTEEELAQVSGGDSSGKDSQEQQKKRIVKIIPFSEATLIKVIPQEIRDVIP